jgi:hypothetical protein
MFCNLVKRFSSLFTKDHLAWTSPNSSLSCAASPHQVMIIQTIFRPCLDKKNLIKC